MRGLLRGTFPVVSSVHVPPSPSLTRLAACVLMVASSSADPSSTSSSLPLPTDEYFAEYGQLYDHVGMLQDHVRMQAYYDAIRLNAERHFKGKVVLDVGAGTGVLSVWAAKAGARRVFAVEATGVASHAEALVEAHGLSDVVTVLNGRMEQLELPEKVDVLLSEWMGYFLLRESMVQSVLYARDKWLKPDGVMYPSHAKLLLAPMAEGGFIEAREASVTESMELWDDLSASLSDRYGLQMEALRPAYEEESVEYAYRNAWQGALAPHARVGAPATLLDVDMRTCGMTDLFGWTIDVELPRSADDSGRIANTHSRGARHSLDETLPVHMLCGWFDVQFCAGGETPADADGNCVELSTAPYSEYTHWAHTTFVLDPPLESGSRSLTVGLTQSVRSHHDLNVTITYGERANAVSASYSITAEFRQNDRSELGAEGMAYDDDEASMSEPESGGEEEAAEM